jgi:hypothetical protein
VAASAREFLGKRRAFGEVERAYLRGAALEVDTSDWYDLRRRRLQLDEVQRITLHREPREGTFLLWLAVGLVSTVLAFLVGQASKTAGAWITFALFAAVGLLRALWTLVFRSSVITVTSPRAKVVIVHTGRPGRSREAFRLLAERTRETQAAVGPAAGETPRAG